MVIPALSIGRPGGPWRTDSSNSTASDAFDLQTALESQLRHILEASHTRSIEGSTDAQVDIENWTSGIISLVKKFVTITPANRDNTLSPVLEPSLEEEPHDNNPDPGKETQPVDIGALKRRIKKLRVSLKNEKEAKAELQKAKDTVDAELERRMGEETKQNEEEADEAADTLYAKEELQVLRESLRAEKRRADELQGELNDIDATIRKKKREVEVDRFEHEAVLKEVEMYRSQWENPDTKALLKYRVELARRCTRGEEEEECILEEIRDPHRHASSPTPRTPKIPLKRVICDCNPTIRSLHRRIADQVTDIALLKKRLAEAKAERQPNSEEAMIELRIQLDETLDELEAAYKETTTADMARDDALAQVRKLEKKMRAREHGQGGAGGNSAFSAKTPAIENHGEGDTKTEKKDIRNGNEMVAVVDAKGIIEMDNTRVGDTEAKTSAMSSGSLADELDKYQEIEDYASEVTMAAVTGQGDGLSQRYDAQVVENSRLREEVRALRLRVRLLETRVKTKGQIDFRAKLAEVDMDLNAVIRKLNEDGISPDPFGFDDDVSSNMAYYNDLIDERDRCISEIEGSCPTRKRLRVVHRTWVEGMEEQIRDWEKKYNKTTKYAEEAESMVSQPFSARMLVGQHHGMGAMRTRIHQLEDLVSAQLEFFRDVQPLLASASNLSTELHNMEAEILLKLESPQERRVKTEEILVKVTEDTGDDADAQEAQEHVSLAFDRVQEAGGVRLERKWYEFMRAKVKLARFVEESRESAYEEALHLGIKVGRSNYPASTPRYHVPELTGQRDPSPWDLEQRHLRPLSTPASLSSSTSSTSPASSLQSWQPSFRSLLPMSTLTGASSPSPAASCGTLSLC